MGRKRVYANAAARVRAHRSRIALLGRLPATDSPKPSLPAQVVAIENEIRSVQAECETWLANLPASIKGTVRADMVQEMIGILAAAADELARTRPAST